MKLSEIKAILPTVDNVVFALPNGKLAPKHFHVTEIGLINKHFIDCGGTVRNESVVNFQLWDANDVDHRLKPQKLLDIIELSERKLGIENFEIEVEYQSDTIGKYDLGFDGIQFNLLSKTTACLASDDCGIEKPKLRLSEIANTTCAPGGGCC